MNPIHSKVLSACALLALGLHAASAQTPPNAGDALRQTQPPVLPPQPAPALPAIGGVQAPIEPPMSALPAGPTIAVTSIEVVGNRVIDTATLSALVADGAGKSLSLADLERIAERITRYYRAHGYFVARAYVPAQDVTSGAVRIRVVEGNYGRFHLVNKSRVRDPIVQGMLDDIKDRDIVSLDTLERAMLIINDTPGVQVTRADVMPGDKVGTSDFAVDAAATAPYDGYILLDDFGSVYTGKNRLSFNVDANSPTGSGDRLSFSGLATKSSDLLNGRLAYSAPLAANGLRGEVAAAKTTYQLGSTYAALDAVGTAKEVDVSLSYPIRRIRAQTLLASVGVAYKDLDDEVRSTGTNTPKILKSATGGLALRDERRVFGADGLTQASASLTVGQLAIGDAAARALDTAGVRTDGTYTKLNADLSRTSLLPARFTLATSLKAQLPLTRNLDGSERMAVSGSGAVMAYPSGELIGDRAVLARVELSRPFPLLGALQSGWLAFADFGEASPWEQTPGAIHRHIADAGFGVNLAYRTAFLHAYLARRVDAAAPLSEPEPRDRFLLQLGYTF